MYAIAWRDVIKQIFIVEKIKLRFILITFKHFLTQDIAQEISYITSLFKSFLVEYIYLFLHLCIGVIVSTSRSTRGFKLKLFRGINGYL